MPKWFQVNETKHLPYVSSSIGDVMRTKQFHPQSRIGKNSSIFVRIDQCACPNKTTYTAGVVARRPIFREYVHDYIKYIKPWILIRFVLSYRVHSVHVFFFIYFFDTKIRLVIVASCRGHNSIRTNTGRSSIWNLGNSVCFKLRVSRKYRMCCQGTQFEAIKLYKIIVHAFICIPLRSSLLINQSIKLVSINESWYYVYWYIHTKLWPEKNTPNSIPSVA